MFKDQFWFVTVLNSCFDGFPEVCVEYEDMVVSVGVNLGNCSIFYTDALKRFCHYRLLIINYYYSCTDNCVVGSVPLFLF